MGAIGNTLKNLGNTAGRSAGKLSVQGGGAGSQIAKLTPKAVQNLNAGSKACPIVSECRDIAQGIAQGDLNKASYNAGVLALATLSSSTAQPKHTVLSKQGVFRNVAAAGVGSQVVKS